MPLQQQHAIKPAPKIIMRNPSLTALLLCLSLTACHTHPKCDHHTNAPAMHNTHGVYRHVVAFKFKHTTTDTQIDQIIEGFARLQDDIPEIIAFEHGKNISPEGLDQDFTHVFLVTFKDKSGLETYLPHPAHKAFVEKLLPLLEQPFVVDYVAQ